MTIWYLNKGAEKKFRGGHPWVFSNELAQSPKGVQPGALVELRDASGGFLARGYGHPNSLISFRTLSLDPSETIGADFLAKRLSRAAQVRKRAGLERWSHRLCFAEADGLPGLIVDRYFTAEREGTDRAGGQVFVLQSSTAGMDRLLEPALAALEALVQEDAASTGVGWDRTAVVLANDSKARLLEGIPVHEKRAHRAIDGLDLERAKTLVQPCLPGLPAPVFEVDFLGGQKTGFFLDQRANLHLTGQILATQIEKGRPLRVLDLCCYIGQWGTQLANLARAKGVEAEVTLVDASGKALEIAARNVAAHGGRAIAAKMDVLENLGTLPTRAYDVVICDPPAFIKKKKDLPTGQSAYLKMNREALRRLGPEGVYVSCSCSGLLGEDDFRQILARAASGSDLDLRWLARGGHSPDHPQKPEFPQGTYLKGWIAVASGLKN